MSDPIRHECAVALLRLRRPQPYYRHKYGTLFYGWQKLVLLLEKQHNRGQDGAGVAGIKLNPEPGFPAFTLEKSAHAPALASLVEQVGRRIAGWPEDPDSAAEGDPLAGDLFLGHLRYGTFGGGGEECCHPFLRQSSCLNRTLLLAGNFNLTNTAELFDWLCATGHHPAGRQDGALILAMIGHYLEQSLSGARQAGDFAAILKQAAGKFDGAYTLCGATAGGGAFALRDPAGIRPGFYYVDDEVAVVASERPAIQTAFDLRPEAVKPLPPGKALILTPEGGVEWRDCLERAEPRQCVFERIYFSRGNDADIHRERKQLGRMLLPAIRAAAGEEWDRIFFSYIPNTAQISFHGVLQALVEEGVAVRFGQVAVKDAKFRTFIADAASRRDFFQHIYDVTYGLVRPGVDTLVVLDDSIVRGNTMRQAILPMLDRLEPRKIVVASAAPPVAYPDCYGIDMSSFGELVAFEAAVSCLGKQGKSALLQHCYERARFELSYPDRRMSNCVRPVYEEVGCEALRREIGERLRPEGLKAELEIVFQRCEDLRTACPGHAGDWYFTGDYPTPGGYRVVNQALVNYVEKKNRRSY